MTAEEEAVIDTARRIVNCVVIKGANPEYHDRVIRRLQEDAPLLWSAIDDLFHNLRHLDARRGQ